MGARENGGGGADAGSVLHDDDLLRVLRVGPGRLRLEGEADLTNREALASVLELAVAGVAGPEAEDGVLEVDLAGLRFADAAAVRALYEAARSGAGIRLLHVAPEVGVVVRLLDRDGEHLRLLAAGTGAVRG